MLEKEKEKVSKIRDIRKREQYMRRQAAIEAFKLERERELSVPILAKNNESKDNVNPSASNYLDLNSYDNMSVNDIDMDDTVNENYYRSTSSLNRSTLNNNHEANNDFDPVSCDLNGSMMRGRMRRPSSQQRFSNDTTLLPSQNRDKLVKLRRNLVINSNTTLNNIDTMNLGNISNNFEDYTEDD